MQKLLRAASSLRSKRDQFSDNMISADAYPTSCNGFDDSMTDKDFYEYLARIDVSRATQNACAEARHEQSDVEESNIPCPTRIDPHQSSQERRAEVPVDESQQSLTMELPLAQAPSTPMDLVIRKSVTSAAGNASSESDGSTHGTRLHQMGSSEDTNSTGDMTEDDLTNYIHALNNPLPKLQTADTDAATNQRRIRKLAFKDFVADERAILERDEGEDLRLMRIEDGDEHAEKVIAHIMREEWKSLGKSGQAFYKEKARWKMTCSCPSGR